MLDFAERIENIFRLHGERPALQIASRTWSYAELRTRTLAIHNAIEQYAAIDEKLIGVVAADHIDTYAAVLAVLRSGRAFVPLNPDHPRDRNASIVSQARLRTICATPGLQLDPAVIGTAFVVDTGTAFSATELPMAAVQAADLAYLLFTSGSTGEPKGVPISRNNLAAFLDALNAAGCAMHTNDRVLQMFDLTFDFSIASYIAPLSCGACVYTVPPGSLKFAEVYRLLEEQSLTVAPMVPSVLTYLRPYFDDIHLPHLRLSFFCGEALLADIATEWMECAPSSAIVNFYGPTEATVFAMSYDWQPGIGKAKALNGVVSIGTPMQGMVALLVDHELRPVVSGEQGELCLAGAQVTPGYWEDDARNRRSFFNLESGGQPGRYYRTGDLAILDEDGDYLFCGRVDHQIKLQGYRVELGEIEHHVRDLVPSHASVIVPHINKLGNVELCLVVEEYDGDLKDVLSALRLRVPSYMVPTRGLTMPNIPLNANGKIDRRAIAKRLEAGLV